MAKFTAKTDTQQDVTEPLESQYTLLANKIQHLQHRQCLIRYYKTEKHMDHLIHAVSQTTEVPQTPANVWELKQKLLKEHGIPVRTALAEANKRKFGGREEATGTTLS